MPAVLSVLVAIVVAVAPGDGAALLVAAGLAGATIAVGAFAARVVLAVLAQAGVPVRQAASDSTPTAPKAPYAAPDAAGRPLTRAPAPFLAAVAR